MNEEDIARAISRDRRFADLHQAIAVEADMRDNVTIKALISYIRTGADVAMREFANTSPLDSNAIGLIMVRVRAYTELKDMLEMILTRGKLAENELRSEDMDFESNG